MDAFSVSLADGLGERNLNAARVLTIAGTFAAFQFVMPVAGWLLVHTAAEKFTAFQKFIPWIALLLLLYIGGKMLAEGIGENRRTSGSDRTGGSGDEKSDAGRAGSAELSAGDLLVQGVATSIDALSVGFTIAAYTAAKALTSAFIIGVVTLLICIVNRDRNVISCIKIHILTCCEHSFFEEFLCLLIAPIMTIWSSYQFLCFWY